MEIRRGGNGLFRHPVPFNWIDRIQMKLVKFQRNKTLIK